MDTRKFARIARAILSKDFVFEAPSHRVSSGLVLFIAGMGVGFIAGILFAPVSGEQLRSDLGDRTRDSLERMKSKAEAFAPGERAPSDKTQSSQQHRPAS